MAPESDEDSEPVPESDARYSLGQWSFHKALFAGEMTNADFVIAAGELGFDGVDYVNQFFADKADDTAFLDGLKASADAAGVEGVVLLVDGAGELGSSDAEDRAAAVTTHLGWVRAAARLGCPFLRVNAHGDGTPEEMLLACRSSIRELAQKAKAYDVRILIENHGGISNNGAWLAELVAGLQDVGVGSLADFDNWCVTRANGQLWGADCTERYNRYLGMTELLPFAESVSVKTFDFDADGNETNMDYPSLFDAMRAVDYQGWLGVEYEGESLAPHEGIRRNLELARRSSLPQPIIASRVRARIDSTLEGLVASGDLAGVSALVYEKGEEVYFGAFGDADRAAGRKMDRETLVQIYSMTKPLTGTALMQLWEAGKFQLDEPVGKYIPELADLRVYTGIDANGEVRTEAPKRAMTVRDLTRHTAGFYNGGATPGLQELWEQADVRARNHTLTELAAKMATYPLAFQPGEQWLYGPSVDMQALLVERISGQPFDEYLEENVLKPLGMDATRYLVPEEDREHLSAVYRRDDDGALAQLPNAESLAFNTSPQVLTPGGWGLTSSLDDYMTFARMLVNEGSLNGVEILKPETVRMMAHSHLSENITERSWLPGKGQMGFGINFAVRVRPPADAAENNGRMGEFYWDGAASTLFWVDPANELTAVLFVQLFPYDPVRLHKQFRDAVYGPWRPVADAVK